jgi:hypothetical protein
MPHLRQWTDERFRDHSPPRPPWPKPGSWGVSLTYSAKCHPQTPLQSPDAAASAGQELVDVLEIAEPWSSSTRSFYRQGAPGPTVLCAANGGSASCSSVGRWRWALSSSESRWRRCLVLPAARQTDYRGQSHYLFHYAGRGFHGYHPGLLRAVDDAPDLFSLPDYPRFQAARKR